MNWISFAEQRPKEEPGRLILVLDKDGNVDLCPSTDTKFWKELTHWAEIEGPDVSVANPNWREKVHHIPTLLEPPPKPDPFEQWWESDPILGDEGKGDARRGWDAAMKFKEGK